MEIVRMTSKNLITIPKKTREKLGIKPGQRFWMEDNDGVIRLTPLPDDPIAFLHGRYKGKPSMTQGLIEDRRREVEMEEHITQDRPRVDG